MHVANAQACLVHELGQIFGHAFGQRCDQRAVTLVCGFAALVDAILYLIFGRTDFDWRVDQAGGSDHLLGEDAASLFHLPIARRRGDISRLRTHHLPLVKAKGPVVDAARQAKAIFSQSQLAPMVPPRHAVDLADGDMAFVHKQQSVVGKILKQCRRRFAGQAACQKAAVILDPRTASGRGDHLEIEISTLLQPLRLQQLAFDLQLFQPLGQFESNRLCRLLHRRARGHIMAVGINAHRIEFDTGFAC